MDIVRILSNGKAHESNVLRFFFCWSVASNLLLLFLFVQTMTTSGTSSGEKGKGQEVEGENVVTDSLAVGDVIYIKLRGGSWWPAQVVDDKSVNESIKPSKKSEGEILVRVYGSYNYLYADPIKSRSEFEKVLKRNNGSIREILQQALEKDLPSNKSSRSKGSSSKAKGTPSESPASKRKSNKKDKAQDEVKRQKQNKMLNDDDADNPTH